MNDGKRYTVRGSDGDFTRAETSHASLEEAIDASDPNGRTIIIDNADGLPACMASVELGCECHRCNGSNK